MSAFEVKRGEALGIMGRNGCGKSTLLKIMCGVYQPTAAACRARGITPILELGVGWNPELDAIDNVCLIGSVMGLSLRRFGSAWTGSLRLRARAVCESEAEALLERHGARAGLCRGVRGGARGAGARRDIRGRRRGLQGEVRETVS
jgi:ABC-type Mn2+/Zn2+ transport system ATPase subunit